MSWLLAKPLPQAAIYNQSLAIVTSHKWSVEFWNFQLEEKLKEFGGWCHFFFLHLVALKLLREENCCTEWWIPVFYSTDRVWESSPPCWPSLHPRNPKNWGCSPGTEALWTLSETPLHLHGSVLTRESERNKIIFIPCNRGCTIVSSKRGRTRGNYQLINPRQTASPSWRDKKRLRNKSPNERSIQIKSMHNTARSNIQWL